MWLVTKARYSLTLWIPVLNPVGLRTVGGATIVSDGLSPAFVASACFYCRIFSWSPETVVVFLSNSID